MGGALLTSDPNVISVALGVLSNYLTDFFQGMSGDKTVKLDVVIEKTADATCKRRDR